ncbi:mercury(II) reductase [Ferroplasma sp.]|uniref:mercury(II) reductase n=1 Tax=Ferroplasma sp. TaxID=2591003 RepID=UPI00307E71F2
MNEYDLAIIGWGAAGFAASIKASELTDNQMKIALIGSGPLGGTCVNVGCVPSKFLIEASKNYKNAKDPLYNGIRSSATINFGAFMESLNNFVKNERESKYSNVIKNFENVDLYDGLAKFTGKNTVSINDKEIKATNFLIATGSRTFIPEIKGLTDYYTSDTIWSLNKIPKKLAIFGSGEVALELAYAFSNFGSEVHIFNRSNRILKGFDEDINRELIKALKNNGIIFHLGMNFNEIKEENSKKSIITWTGTFTDFDALLVATGRIPNIDGLNLKAAGISTDNGIVVDDKLKTTNPSIYAAGDCIKQPLKLETLAGKEGVIAVENIFGSSKYVKFNEIPWVVFTEPNVASVGSTESELKKKNIEYTVRTVELKNVVKANILQSYTGIAKIIADKDKKILGIHVVAPNAAEFIIEGVSLIKNGLTYDDLIDTVHVFPTVAESIKIAGQAFIRDISKMSCCMD